MARHVGFDGKLRIGGRRGLRGGGIGRRGRHRGNSSSSGENGRKGKGEDEAAYSWVKQQGGPERSHEFARKVCLRTEGSKQERSKCMTLTS